MAGRPLGAGADRRGFGKKGYCLLCSWEHVIELDRLIRQGRNNAECAEWAKSRFGFTWNRQTFYKHRDEHAKSPEDRVIQASQKSPGQSGLVVRKSSNNEFLEAIRDIGLAKAVRDPEDISIDHALKAAQILETRKDRAGDQINLLVQIVTQGAPPIQVTGPVIEGEATEIT